MKEQQKLWQPTQQEYAELYQANNADIWLENKKLKAALRKAAEIVAKSYCPANYECPLENTECGGGAECTQEIAEECWMGYWMGEGGDKDAGLHE